MKRSRKAGMTLIEVLIYAAILGILANAVLAIFYKAEQLNRLLSRRLFDLQAASQMTQRLKQDVRSARGFLRADMEAGGPEEVLILDCEESVRIVYALENGRVVRKRYEGEAAEERPFRPPIARLCFSYDAQTPEEARLVTVNIELQRRSRTRGKGRVFSMQVALRSKEVK